MRAFVGQRRTRDAAARLLEWLTVVGSAAHGHVQPETLLVGTKHLHERRTAPCSVKTICPARAPTAMR